MKQLTIFGIFILALMFAACNSDDDATITENNQVRLSYEYVKAVSNGEKQRYNFYVNAYGVSDNKVKRIGVDYRKNDGSSSRSSSAKNVSATTLTIDLESNSTYTVWGFVTTNSKKSTPALTIHTPK